MKEKLLLFGLLNASCTNVMDQTNILKKKIQCYHMKPVRLSGIVDIDDIDIWHRIQVMLHHQCTVEKQNSL